MMRLGLFLLTLSCVLVCAVQAEEVLVNGDFETPNSDWTITGTDGQWRTDTVHEGSYSIVLGKSNNDGGAYQTTSHNIVEGNSYTLSYYMTISATGRPVTAQLYYMDADTQVDIPGWSLTVEPTDTSNSTWDTGTATFVAAPGADYIGMPIGVRFSTVHNWTFLDTVSLTSEQPTDIPVIITQPTSQMVKEGETAALIVEAINISTGDTTGLTYQWKQAIEGQDDPNLATTDNLTFESATPDDAGSYYCVITAPNGSVTTNTVSLGIKKLVAHYTMNQADYVDGLYIDVSGNGHDAVVSGTLDSSAFVAGANGDTAGAVSIFNDPNAYAIAGTFDPGETATISAWVKMDPSATTDTCLTAKADSSTSWDNARWDFVVQSGKDAVWINLSTNIGTGSILGDAGQWQHLVLTIDTNNVATIYQNGEAAVIYSNRSFGSDVDGIVSIGARANGSIPLAGELDDVRIYNYALTAQEVAQLYVDVAGGEVCYAPPAMDFNDDCVVDLADFAAFAADWMSNGIISAQ